MLGLVSIDGKVFRWLGTCSDLPSCPAPLDTVEVTASATRTVSVFEVPNMPISITVTFLSTLFTDDYPRLSRPISYVSYDVSVTDGTKHNVVFYLDASGQHVVDNESEVVTWGQHNATLSSSRLHAAVMGSKNQNVLGGKGDKFHINWGYLYLASTVSPTNVATGGSAKSMRDLFITSASLSALPEDTNFRSVNNDMPAIAITNDLGQVSGTANDFVMVAYDDIESIYYFGEEEKGLWTNSWVTIDDAIIAAASEYQQMLAKSVKHDDDLFNQLSASGGEKYATLCMLAYRQTLAALKPTYSEGRGAPWIFLKEISTNGDEQTMDVLFPASPALLYVNPDMLTKLLEPVLAYANNETYIAFTDPYSPHQLGTYPISNDTTKAQEPMPMENTGNMFLMLLGVVQHTKGEVDTSFFYPKYWPMLTKWADYLSSSLPFPANQICTDDFTGPLANNTNLAAKGIIALQAFSELCTIVEPDNKQCDVYAQNALGFLDTFKHYGLETDAAGLKHYKIAFDVPQSYSLKYNLVWSQLLQLKDSAAWEEIIADEVAYYKTKGNKYGVPLDMRHTYVKSDWLAWAATLASSDEDFHTLFDPIYDMCQETESREPFTDLYDTITAKIQWAEAFVARPVIGGLFAKALKDSKSKGPSMISTPNDVNIETVCVSKSDCKESTNYCFLGLCTRCRITSDCTIGESCAEGVCVINTAAAYSL